MSFLISFDIGHSSIGWGVLSAKSELGSTPTIHGCGSVIFPADDCLASQRRGHRRTRRNIRATRQRIARIRKLLLHLGVLDQQSLDAVGHAAPHVLAARVLIEKKPMLTWSELWSVIRWYAHNRGYDGNARWSRDEADHEDSEKELAALELMKQHGTEGKSMAETICAALGVNPTSDKISSTKPFKTLNAAFPRKIVRQEVLDILKVHMEHLPSLDLNFVNTLVAPEGQGEHRAWETIPVPDLHLPRRYYGGLLFGQLVPRFDNRIIARCPISGEKVPNKATREFLDFRWAMILANLRVDGRPLSAGLRQALHEVMKSKGRLTSTELRKELEAISGSKNNNIKGYFDLHPDSADALVFDPALALYNGEGAGSKSLKPYWECLPEITRKKACGRWKKGRIVNLNWMLEQCASDADASDSLREIIDAAYASDQKKKKPKYITFEHFLNQSFAPTGVSGRAPYSRAVMRNAFDFVLSTDRHPTEASTDELVEGPLYRSKAVLSAERDVSIPKLTNNHLIRQRLDILLRLVDDILAEYADNDPSRVTDVVVEVASDLQTYSGLSAKEMQGELTKRLSHFKSAVAKLEKEAPELQITGSLIRKCRIAMDLNWKCPFTGKDYRAHQLSQMEREHLIPYSDRPTNALDALVLTFPWVNHMKGKRTAMAFINEVAGDQRFLTPKGYCNFVDKLKVAKKATHPEDFRRQISRKKLMLLEKYEAKDHGFTAGALTQTSHLNRLSARQLEKRFIDAETNEPTVRIHSIPGQVTAETRKAWRMLGTLAIACPEIQDEDGKPKNKTEIRGITHLHHALDAAVLGLTHLYLPGNLPGGMMNEKGAIWTAMLKRRKSQSEQDLLMQTGMFASHYRDSSDVSNKELDVHLLDLPKEIKEQLSQRLAEKRVAQHIPADQSGASLELNPWRVRHIEDGYAVISQRESDVFIQISKTVSRIRNKPFSDKEKQERLKLIASCPDDAFTDRERNQVQSGLMKVVRERVGKLVGLRNGKLSANKSVLVISENYGLAIDPEPTIISRHSVSKAICELRKRNSGEKPRILRNGMLVRLSNVKDREGIWRIASCKASLTLDLMSPVRSKMESKGPGFWREVSVVSLLKKKAIEILPARLTGHNSNL